MESWLILGVAIGYLCVLFAIARWGDRRADAGRSVVANPTIYALSMAVYCTAWTFYGSVGRAAASGIDFVAIYLGPTLVAVLWWHLVRKMLRISKANRITSIADFVAARYGKSPLLGGLVAIHSNKRKGSTTRAKEHPLAPDLVGRDFNVDGPDRLWVADFTQLTTWQGTCYIAVVADAYSRLCLGWSVRADKTVELVLEALDMAIWRRGQMRAAGAIHHSDQGSQYTSFAFTRRLSAEGLVGSMGTVGDALDNAMCESLIGTMKIEKLNRQPWRSVEDVRAAVFAWIETWYNRRRRHSSLGYLSPLEYESQHYDGHTITNP